MIFKSNLASKTAAWMLATFNLIVMVFCLVLFSLCLWAVASPQTLSNTIQQWGSDALIALLPPKVLTVQNGVGAASLATFVFFIALMGMYGAVTRSQYLLFMYSTLVILLLLLECALTFYFSSDLIEKGLQEQDGQWTHALRLLFNCCDLNNSTSQITLKPPWSCCGPGFYPTNCTITDFYPKECQSTITQWIDRNIAAVYTTLAVLHLLLSSLSLVRRSSCTSRPHS